MRCFLIFFSSLIVVLFVIPVIIKVTRKSRMFDEPLESRKIHKSVIPNSGGIAIFLGFLFSCMVFIPFDLLPQANALMAAAMIVFMMGLKDDIDSLAPYKKFVAQFVAGVIIIALADVRITSFYGILGIYELSFPFSAFITMLVFVGVVNAFNLIDGIDGLAGSLGVLLSSFYTFLFFEVGQLGYAYLSASLAGALIGFLWFNFTPAKIFMGDSGSLLLGFIAVVLGIRLTGADILSRLNLGPLQITSGLSLVVSVLVIPIFDTIRVFSIRISKGRSPFVADRNHLHHRLLLLGLSHTQTTLILALSTLILVSIVLLLQNFDDTILLFLIVSILVLLNFLLTGIILYYKKQPLQTKKHFKKIL